MWTAGLTVEIKLRFRDGLVWKVGLTVEIKLPFRDGLVWTVDLTEIKLRFQISLDWASIFNQNGSHCNLTNNLSINLGITVFLLCMLLVFVYGFSQLTITLHFICTVLVVT